MKPWAPGDSIAGQRYVSDVLEALLDARETRAAMRTYALKLLDDAGPALRERLQPVAAYVGGKCMGYPAVWFLEHLLAGSIARDAIIERARAPLAVSLSTSIVDDLADGDELVRPETLAFLYVLIGSETFGGNPRDAVSHAYLRDALETCLDAGGNADAIARRGGRIGAFYAMIAARVLDGLWNERESRIAIDAIARFGEFCAHVDDWMDARRDFERGVLENVALVLLREHVAPEPLLALHLELETAWLREEMRTLLARSLDEIGVMLAPLASGNLLRQLRLVGERLRGAPTPAIPHQRS